MFNLYINLFVVTLFLTVRILYLTQMNCWMCLFNYKGRIKIILSGMFFVRSLKGNVLKSLIKVNSSNIYREGRYRLEVNTEGGGIIHIRRTATGEEGSTVDQLRNYIRDDLTYGSGLARLKGIIGKYFRLWKTRSNSTETEVVHPDDPILDQVLMKRNFLEPNFSLEECSSLMSRSIRGTSIYYEGAIPLSWSEIFLRPEDIPGYYLKGDNIYVSEMKNLIYGYGLELIDDCVSINRIVTSLSYGRLLRIYYLQLNPNCTRHHGRLGSLIGTLMTNYLIA